MDLQRNIDRFNGFADIYESARPSVPVYPVKIILQYLGHKPGQVADLGCGTGLSTQVWASHCDTVTGIEPGDDMRAVAIQKAGGNMNFIKGYGHDTGFADASCDVVVCSQSFHWMEPVSTLSEINRILKKGGVFATIDCIWPPVSIWRADKAYHTLQQKIRLLEKELPQVKHAFIRYKKEKHLSHISDSRHFRYAREVLFSNTEACTRQRFISLMLSQGSLQEIQRKYPALLKPDIDDFMGEINSIFTSEPFPVDFSYRMNIAVK